jgi:hypothetical protein
VFTAQQAARALVPLPTQSSRLPNLQVRRESSSGSGPVRSHAGPGLNPTQTSWPPGSMVSRHATWGHRSSFYFSQTSNISVCVCVCVCVCVRACARACVGGGVGDMGFILWTIVIIIIMPFTNAKWAECPSQQDAATCSNIPELRSWHLPPKKKKEKKKGSSIMLLFVLLFLCDCILFVVSLYQ